MNFLLRIWELLPHDLAIWGTIVLPLFTFFLGMWFNQARGKKKMRLIIGKNLPSYDGHWIFATNKSIGRSINIDRYGYKTWNGDIIEEKYQPIQIDKLLEPEQAEELPFYDDKSGQHKSINPCEIYYIYVKDKAGKFYRKYTYPRIMSWSIRFLRFCARN